MRIFHLQVIKEHHIVKRKKPPVLVVFLWLSEIKKFAACG